MLSFSKNGQQQKASAATAAPPPAPVSSDPHGHAGGTTHRRPDPEVVQKASRRRFSPAYKRAIIAEVDACQHSGETGAILRREGLYYSTLRSFRQQMEPSNHTSSKGSGARGTKGRKLRSSQGQAERISQLEREKKRLEKKLQQAQAVISVQKKVSELLGLTLEHSTLGLDLEWDEEDR